MQLDDWRGGGVARIARRRREHDGKTVIKEEQMPDGRLKLILKDESTGEFVDVVADARPGRLARTCSRASAQSSPARRRESGARRPRRSRVAGARVAGLDLLESDTEVSIVGDTSDVAAVERAADALGGVDIWVNNAARLFVRPVVETTDEEWHSLLGPNLHGYFYGCRAAARRMLAQGTGGRIVNVTSAVNVFAVPDSRRVRRRQGRDRVADEGARARARRRRESPSTPSRPERSTRR